jgi:hypothetical protein
VLSASDSRNSPTLRERRIRNTITSAVTVVHNQFISLPDGQEVSSTSADCDGAHSRASAKEGARAWVTCRTPPQTSAADSGTPRRWLQTQLVVRLLMRPGAGQKRAGGLQREPQAMPVAGRDRGA